LATPPYFRTLIHVLFISIMSKQLLIASLACFPLIGVAQTDPTPRHFYIGVGANLLTNVPFNSAGVPRLVGPALTAGVQVGPRWALQAGMAYHWTGDSYTTPSYYYGNGGVVGGRTITTRYQYFTAPVLLRYTLTSMAERFHMDGLAGITLLRSFYHYSNELDGYSFPGGQIDNTATKASFTLGPAVRYTLTPHVELTANGLVSALLGDSRNFSDRLFLNALVGAHYTFGQH
jgi:hypothetical protein